MFPIWLFTGNNFAWGMFAVKCLLLTFADQNLKYRSCSRQVRIRVRPNFAEKLFWNNIKAQLKQNSNLRSDWLLLKVSLPMIFFQSLPRVPHRHLNKRFWATLTLILSEKLDFARKNLYAESVNLLSFVSSVQFLHLSIDRELSESSIQVTMAFMALWAQAE